MRFEGTLHTWYAERGHGSVMPQQGGEPLFVHISAFPMDGEAPQEGERLSFEIVSRSDGRKQAVKLQRLRRVELHKALQPARAPRSSTSRPPSIAQRRRSGAVWLWLAGLALVAGLGWMLWPQVPDASKLAQHGSTRALTR